MNQAEMSEKIKKLSDYICAELQLTEVASSDFLKILLDMLTLFDKKQHDYGPGNIGAFGTFGVVIRMNDKMERLKNVMSKKRGRAKNETIQESLVDLANYSIIALMLEKGWWPK